MTEDEPEEPEQETWVQELDSADRALEAVAAKVGEAPEIAGQLDKELSRLFKDLRALPSAARVAEVEVLVENFLGHDKYAGISGPGRAGLSPLLQRGVLEFLDQSSEEEFVVRDLLVSLSSVAGDLSAQLEEAGADAEGPGFAPARQPSLRQDLFFFLVCPTFLVQDLASIASGWVYASYVDGSELASISVAIAALDNRFGFRR